MHYEPFSKVTCPECGMTQTSRNMKFCYDYPVSETYLCDCGTRFIVEMHICTED